MLNDLKFTLRSFRRQPGFALAAIATLAVGIGATTAIFSTVNAAILRPLPFPHPEDLFALDTPTTDGRPTTGLVSGAEMLYLNGPSIAYVAGSGRTDATIQLQDGTVLNTVAYGVTEGFFDLLGLAPIAGRTFTVTQQGQACTYTVTPGGLSVPAAGVTNTLSIATLAGCAWTASGLPSWVTLATTGQSGPSQLSYTVAANTGPARSATLTVAGKAVVVNQTSAPPPATPGNLRFMPTNSQRD